MNWYLIRCQPGKDSKVKKSIFEQLDLYKLKKTVFDIIIPTEKDVRLKNGKKIIRSKNLLPGYVFIQADLTNNAVIEIINNTPGCFGFMGTDKKTPTPLKQSEVDKMLGTGEEIVADKTQWLKNQKIKISEGPFKDFEGVITEVDVLKLKLKVEVKIFGRPTSLELDYQSAVKID